jgi:hypothetical protein
MKRPSLPWILPRAVCCACEPTTSPIPAGFAAVTALGILAYGEPGRVTVEIPDIVDHANEADVAGVLRHHLELCAEPVLVVRLDDPVVTTSALRVVHTAYLFGRSRGIAVRAVVDPLAVKVFSIAGLDYLLDSRAP